MALQHKPTRTLSGDRNQCTGCGEYFNSTAAFDKHRHGDHAGNQRVCRTPSEMVDIGMSKNSSDYWVTKAREWGE